MLVARWDASQYWKASIVCDPSRVADRLQRTPTYSSTSTNYNLLLLLVLLLLSLLCTWNSPFLALALLDLGKARQQLVLD